MIGKMNDHYAFTNPATIHDEEALTSLELSARTAGKMNETVDAFNKLEAETHEHLQTQDDDIKHQKDVVIPETIETKVDEHITSGKFDRQIDKFLGNLEERVDNLLGSYQTGGTTSDAELIDLRTDSDGNTYTNAGDCLRSSILKATSQMCLYDGYLDIDTRNKVVKLVDLNGNENTEHLLSIFGLKGGMNKPLTLVNTSTNYPAGTSAYVIVINTNTFDFRVEPINNYVYTPHDVALCGLVTSKDSLRVIPLSLSLSNIRLNGFKIDYEEVKKAERRVAVYKGYLNVDTTNKTATLYSSDVSGNTILMMEFNSYSPKNQSYTFDTLSVELFSGSTLVFINTKDSTLKSSTLTNYRYKEGDVLLCGYYSGYVYPIALSAECIRVNGTPLYNHIAAKSESLKTINDCLKGLVNDGTKPFKIVLGGDSITHGVGGTGWAQDGDEIVTYNGRTWNHNTQGYCWAKLFKEYIESNYNATVTNNGCTGSDSSTWNGAKETLIPTDTDLVILTIGTNDRNIKSGVATKQDAINKYYNNLVSIVNYCRNNNIEIILVSPIPASISNESTTDRACHMCDINSVVQKVAGEFNMEYANMHNEMYYYMMDNGKDLNSYLSDGLHPNDAGYKLMFYRLLKLLNLAPHFEEVD